YLWLDSLPLATIDADYDAQGKVGNPTLLYLHGDHLDTPRLATDASGQIAWQWQSDAFGRGEALSQGSTQVNLRFPGQYYDAESGLHYNYFRDYDPETGRYVESDPIGLAGGLNTYVYVEGNPLAYVDEWGHSKTNGKHANKSSPMTVGDFNKNSDPAKIQEAIREAETNGKNAHAKALKGLLKVIKRTKSLTPNGVIEDILENICETHPEEPACKIFTPPPAIVWCKEGETSPPLPPMSSLSSPDRPEIIDLGQL
ncbi:RHS repeat protein, partial [Pseudomonas aeruginosa]